VNATLKKSAAIRIGIIAAAIIGTPSGLCLAGGAEEFGRLESKLEREMERYDATLRSMLAKNPHLDFSDPTKLPPDPRPEILREMDALATANADSADGFDMHVAVLYWSIQIGAKDSPERFARLARGFPDNRDLVDVFVDLEYASSEIGPVDGWTPTLQELVTKTKNDAVRRQGRLLLARLQMAQGQNTQAIANLKKLISSSDKALAGKAKSYLFDLEHLQIGMTIPDFETTTLDGKKVSIQSLRGKVVLIDFWATWCPSCVAEFPTILKAVDKFKADFVVLGLSADEQKEAIVKFSKTRKVPGIQTWDKTEGRFPVFEQFNVQGLPTWFLVDAKGTIRAKDPFGRELIPAIEKALKTK